MTPIHLLLPLAIIAVCVRCGAPAPEANAASRPATPLLSFYQALGALQAGQAKAPVAVLQIGDSHTANDSFSGRMRELFQGRFGDAGRGMMQAGIPFRYYHPNQVTVTASGWRTISSYDPATPGPFGLSGLRQTATGPAEMRLQADYPGGIANANPPGYWGMFFFSVETLATVGYGDMHPQTVFTHIVAAIEIFLGMMSVGVIAGVMFSRFSRPVARFVFAEHAVIRPFDGRPTLILRAANARQNVVMEAQAQLRLIREERTIENETIRRIYDLPLRRNQHPIFILGWTLMHIIDESSPMRGETAESLTRARANLVLTLSGTDESTGQTLMTRKHYRIDALRWNHTFADILTQTPDGLDLFDYSKFHLVEPLAEADRAAEAASATPGSGS